MALLFKDNRYVLIVKTLENRVVKQAVFMVDHDVNISIANQDINFRKNTKKLWLIYCYVFYCIKTGIK